MKSKWTIIFTVLMLGLLAACSPSSTGQEAPDSNRAISAGTPDQVRLQDDYNDALSIQGQLAAGTLLLEDTPQAVDEALAAALLPLWQAVQSLTSSDTAAPAEINAVLNQIQDLMDPAQVEAIAALNLTTKSLTTLIEEGDLLVGFSGRDQTGERTEGQAGGFPGGGLDGGIPGGRPGGGPGGGFGSGGGDGLDPEALATRQAQFEAGDAGTVQDRMLLGAVVRLLGTKTGETSPDGPRIFDTVFTLVSEATGLSVDDIRAQTAEGSTLAEILEVNGGDVEAVRTALVEALAQQPELGGQDPAQLAAQWLGLEE